MADYNFNQNMNNFFGSEAGAYSEVTEREFFDSQITVTALEKPIFLEHLRDIPRGSVKELKARGVSCSYPFRLYPTGEIISLNVTHPKAKGNELRLYLQLALFKPDEGLTWFVFEKNNEIWIGALDHFSIISIRSGVTFDASQKALIDFSDVEYQDSLHQKDVPQTVEQTVKRIKRNPAVARKALEDSKYQCEIYPEFPIFTSKSSGLPYLEAHHLVPIGLQPMFDTSLDVAENICILNPYAHRMVHHATYSEIEGHIQALLVRREDFLNSLGIDVDRVLDIYGRQ